MKIDEPIVWSGNLNDDCTAIWNGLILRAEWMDEEIWWWAVSINDGRLEEIDSSNNYDTSCIGGEKARKFAEHAAIKYLTENSNPYNIVVLDLFNTSIGVVAIFDTPEILLVGMVIQREDSASWKITGTSLPKMSDETNAYKHLDPPRLLRDCLIKAQDSSNKIQIGDRFSLK
jgi:hypothetical protein